MPDKRKVHDILAEHGIGPNGEQLQRRPVALIQHGNPEDGFTYEGICPWCGETTCYVPDAQTKVIGGLYRVLLSQQKIHWLTCKSAVKGAAFSVEVADRPLDVQRKFEVQ